MKVGIIGAVGSTLTTIKFLNKYHFDIVGILGFEPDNPTNVSGLAQLSFIAEELGVPYMAFKKINERQHIEWMQEKVPDIIFAVGFSQLINDAWLNMSRLGCVGFHPTKLPKGRGRAPLAWLILKEREGAATFFLMGKGADNGPIFVQEPFFVGDEDDAGNVSALITRSLEKALDKWLPELKKGIWNPMNQDEADATYYGKRNPEDGLIAWSESAIKIHNLIKATSKPYPGAFTFFNKCKLVVWKSSLENTIKITGVPGRVLLKNDKDHLLLQTGDGLIWLINYMSQSGKSPSVGSRLGYIPEIEIDKIWQEIREIQNDK